MDTKKNGQVFLSCDEKLRIKIVYPQEENIDNGKGADWHKEERNKLAFCVHRDTSGNFKTKIQAGHYQKLSVSESCKVPSHIA